MSDTFQDEIIHAVTERLAEERAIKVPLQKLTRDMINAEHTLSTGEARFLVDSYYTMQEGRIRAANQIRALTNSGEPHDVLKWLATENRVLEESIKLALDLYSGGHPVGSRMRTVLGIGPVIAAGLLAHIDIKRAKTAGAIWRYAGLDPTSEWKKGEKRPFNASLKTLCWKLGESFVKVSGNEKSIYGRLYRERKEIELAKNEAGDFADQAAAKLERFKIGKTTDAYKAYSKGKLPPAHVHARAKRVAVKMFLSHLHEIWYEIETGEKAPVPYIMTFANHTHRLDPDW